MTNSSEISNRIRVNLAVGYILDHLEEALDVDTLANIACLSRFHFHRVFLLSTGLTPAEYVEYARMNAIVHALRHTQETVTTIAFNTGFQSGAALAKAMRRRYGLAPLDVRKAAEASPLDIPEALDIRAFRRPKCRTQLKPRIAEVPSRSVLCATEFGMANNQGIAAFTRAIGRAKDEIERQNLSGEIFAQVLLIPDAPKGPNDPTFRTIAGFVLRKPVSIALRDTELQYRTIGGGRHAIFTHAAPSSTVWQSWFAIHHAWFPATGYKPRNQTPFQMTLTPGSERPYRAEIFIPIV